MAELEGFYKHLEDKFDAAVHDGSLSFTQSEIHPAGDSAMEIRYTLASALSKKTSHSQYDTEAGHHRPHETPTPAERNASPWLPPEESLLVVPSYRPQQYMIVLNKFAVSKGHFLLVTKRAERQDTPLDEDILAASYELLQAANKQSGTRHIAFFNSGPNSGASLLHKHIQFIKLPQDGFKPFPDNVLAHDPAAKSYRLGDNPLSEEQLNFAHFIVPVPTGQPVTGEILALMYSSLMSRVLTTIGKNNYEGPTSYNLLFTEEWMIAVPRRVSEVYGISINSLGCVGLILAKNAEELAYCQEMGAMTLLSTVAFPKENIELCERSNDLGYTRY